MRCRARLFYDKHLKSERGKDRKQEKQTKKKGTNKKERGKIIKINRQIDKEE